MNHTAPSDLPGPPSVQHRPDAPQQSSELEKPIKEALADTILQKSEVRSHESEYGMQNAEPGLLHSSFCIPPSLFPPARSSIIEPLIPAPPRDGNEVPVVSSLERERAAQPDVGCAISIDAARFSISDESELAAGTATVPVAPAGVPPADPPAPIAATHAALSESGIATANLRLRILQTVQALQAEGLSALRACLRCRVDQATYSRWRDRYTAQGFEGLIPRTHQRGRNPSYQPTEAELALVRSIYLKLDDSKRGGSKVAAYRLAAKSHSPEISELFRGVVLNRRSRTLPPSWERLLQTPQSVIQHLRDKTKLFGTYINTPRGRYYVAATGEEMPLRCGSVFESDDGTLNFYAYIPWPFGGDKCSDRFGVRLGRWQFLPIVDVASEFCLSFDIVARFHSSYRGEDVRGLFGRTFAEVARPEALRLERGSWESEIVRHALELASIPVFNAWEPKHKNAVERFFDRLWTPLSLIPGHVGRDRGRFSEVQDIALNCQDGRRDPREHFLSLEDATSRVVGAVEFCNGEPIESRSGWGRWTPQQRWVEQVGNRPSIPSPLASRTSPLTLMPEQLRVFFSREQRDWTVRGNLLGGNVAGPDVKFPVYFQTEELWQFEGCLVRCYFDPYADPVLGTLVLQKEWRSYSRGHVIARDVPALELPPQIVLAADGWGNSDAHNRSLAVRKAIAKAVRTETWDWSGKRTSKARDGMGNEARRESAGVGPVCPHTAADGVARPTAPRPRAARPTAPETIALGRAILSAETDRRVVSEPETIDLT